MKEGGFRKALLTSSSRVHTRKNFSAFVKNSYIFDSTCLVHGNVHADLILLQGGESPENRIHRLPTHTKRVIGLAASQQDHTTIAI